MPIYGFTCFNCGHTFDKLQKVQAENPPCLKPTARQLSAPGFQLKGTGWYATDFKESKR